MAIGKVAPQPVLKGFQARRQNHGIWEAIPITNSSWHEWHLMVICMRKWDFIAHAVYMSWWSPLRTHELLSTQVSQAVVKFVHHAQSQGLSSNLEHIPAKCVRSRNIWMQIWALQIFLGILPVLSHDQIAQEVMWLPFIDIFYCEYYRFQYSQSSHQRPPLEFRKVVAARAGRSWEGALI